MATRGRKPAKAVTKAPEEVVVETPKKTRTTKKTTRWIIDATSGVKKCEACGAIMHGWAHREPFQFCPKCGLEAEKAL